MKDSTQELRMAFQDLERAHWGINAFTHNIIMVDGKVAGTDRAIEEVENGEIVLVITPNDIYLAKMSWPSYLAPMGGLPNDLNDCKFSKVSP